MLDLTDQAASADLDQLSKTQYRRFTTNNDAPLGLCWSASWCLQHRREFQYRSSDPTTNPHLPQPSHLGPMQVLWKQMVYIPRSGHRCSSRGSDGWYRMRTGLWPESSEDEHHVHWPKITFMAVLSACLLCAGVLRHYWDIYKERTVRGISHSSLSSLMRSATLPRWYLSSLSLSWRVLGMVIYASELVLWSGVMACGGYYNLRPWIEAKLAKRKSARQGGVTILNAETAAEDVERRDSSSSSVFRTASSVHDLPIAMRLRSIAPSAP